MIRGHFKNFRSSRIFVKQPARVMNCERGRIMIRMSAFVRLGDHDFRFQFAEKIREAKRDGEELMRRLLIGDAELDYAVFGNAGERECRDRLLPSSLGVIVAGGEACLLGIEHVGGRAVRNMNDTTFPKT